MERGSNHLLLIIFSVFFWVLFSWVHAYTEVYYMCFTRFKLPSGERRDVVLKVET